MKKTILTAGLYGIAVAGASPVAAQDARFTWEGSVEVGIDSTVRADDPNAEITDTYLSAEAAFEAALSDRITAFGGLTLESVTDAGDDRQFDDLGLYVNELGLRFGFGETVVSVGKLSPVFAVAWDEAPGFYGTALAGDYELAEMIGVTVDTPVGAAGGVLSFAVFYADDTALSDSIGTKRGRNSVAAGGVGNTGKLNNVSLQYSQEFGDTTAWIGARHLSAGTGDTSDETGYVAGVSHDFGNGLSMIGELAHFNGAGGADGNATYATLGGAYAMDDWTFSATATLVDTPADTDSMIALGVDHAITENVEINFGVARFDVGGEKSTAVGLAAVVSF
ncbi:porin [Sulfitobacter sp. F26169L]|uniref:porin n=1 Tax=Sulfitobacter sp. F26169L TaxID=2996015 RepID=UPI002260BC04|nr:porin [Sulfitobacter sp. F26169L]MCX7566358.1 porin [Sulfitobacter sp. F26169L]